MVSMAGVNPNRSAMIPKAIGATMAAPLAIE
jgi:hypothetical protein